MAEIITVERRRRWSEEDKRRIVRETLLPDASVNAVAKRHGLHASQVFTWRRTLREDVVCASEVGGHFAPVLIGAPATEPERSPVAREARPTTEGGGRIEIVLGRGRRIVVGPDVDAAALRRALDVLERR